MNDVRALPESAPGSGRVFGGRLAWLAVLVAATLPYLGTLRHGFTWDDELLIVREERLADPAHVLVVLGRERLWRPLETLSFMLDRALFGLEHPWGFHATNILLHGLASLALLALFRQLGCGPRVALLGALLFAVHPIHVEAVACVSHRKEAMVAALLALALIAWLRARPIPPQPPLESRRSRVGWIAASAACFLAALLAKEAAAVVLPALIVAVEVLLRGTPLRRLAAPLVPATAALALFFTRGPLADVLRSLGPERVLLVTDGVTTSYGRLLLTSLQALGDYLGLLVLPWPLVLDRAVSVPRSLLEPGPLGGLLVLCTVLAAALVLRRRMPHASLGIAWTLLALLPFLNLVPLTWWLVADRFLYVPSAGFALATAALLVSAWSRLARRAPRLRLVGPALAATLLTVAALHAAVQSENWHDSATLWRHVLEWNPGSERALYGIGLEHDRAGDSLRAEEFYRRALVADRLWPDPHDALTRLLLRQGRALDALLAAADHVDAVPEDSRAWTGAGRALLALGRAQEARAAFGHALRLAPADTGALEGLIRASRPSPRHPTPTNPAGPAPRLTRSLSLR